MSNSLESIIKLLSSDSNAAEKLTNAVKSMSEKDSPTTVMAEPSAKNDRLEQKINLIKAITPLLGDKAIEKADFLIKLLTVITLIRQLNNNSGTK